jgi:hypothetical protein
MTNELAIRNETRLTGLAAFAQDNDAVMLAGDPLYFKKGTWYRGQQAFDPGGLHFIANYEESYTGWTRWSEKKPIEHRLVRCADYSRNEPREALGFTDKTHGRPTTGAFHKTPGRPATASSCAPWIAGKTC